MYHVSQDVMNCVPTEKAYWIPELTLTATPRQTKEHIPCQEFWGLKRQSLGIDWQSLGMNVGKEQSLGLYYR
jgi:hypothetical protein